MSNAEQFNITSIVNYNRKSRQDIEREKKTGEDTLAEIIKLMTDVLDKHGIPYEQRNEIGSGDKIETRPIFQEVLVDIEKGKFDAIAVKEISRLGRGSYTDMGKIYDLIIERRIYIITPWKIYDPQNNADLRQIRFELFLSREEFETTRERLIGGRYSGAMQGRWVAGQSPFGYRYNDKTQRLEPDEDAAKIIRFIYDLYVNGIPSNGRTKEVSFRAIATHLKRLNIDTASGKNSEWRPIQIKRVIENPVYNGEVHFRTRTRKGNKYVERPKEEHIIVKDAHEPLIDPDTWEKAQEKLNDKSRKIPRSKLDFSPCELAGLFVCEDCGRKLVRQYSTQHYTKQDGSKSIYHKEFLWCTTSGCTFVKYREVEENLLEYLRELTSLDKDTLQRHLQQSVIKNETQDQEIIDIKEHITKKRKEIQSRLNFIFEKYEAGIYTDKMFLERKEKYEKELKDLDEVKVEKHDKKVDSISPEKISKNINSYLQTYDKLDDKTEKNELLRIIFDHINLKILEKGRGRKSAKFQITPILKDKILM